MLLSELFVRITGSASGLDREMARAGKSIEGFRRNVFSLNSTLGTLTSAFGVGLGVGAVTGLFSEAAREADKLNASMRKLQATAKITGVDFGFLQSTAKGAQDNFGLAATVANDLTTEITKLTQKSGDISQTGNALRAFLDLGAARGLSANETLKAVQQSILGIDEGTDKLFGANPSVLYARFAESIGTTAGKLTELQKAQALVVAAMQDGGKVVGEFAARLETVAGQAERAATEFEKAKARLGEASEPQRLWFWTELADQFERLNAVDWSDFWDGLRSGLPPVAVFAGAVAAARKEVERNRLTLPATIVTPPSSNAPAADPTPFSEIVDELEKEVKLLTEARDLSLLRSVNTARAHEIEAQLRKELDSGNRTLEERVRITKLLQSIQWFPSSTTIAEVDAALRGLEAPRIVAQVERVETGMERLLRTTEAWQEQLQQSRREFEALGGTLHRIDLPQNGERAPTRQFGESQKDFLERFEEYLDKITQAEIRSFNERIGASREVISAFSDLAVVTETLSAEMSAAFRSLETALAGLSRIREGGALLNSAAELNKQSRGAGNQIGLLGAAATLSGALSVASGVVSLVDTLFSSGSRAREAQQELRSAIEAWADELVPKDALTRAISALQGDFAELAKGISETFGIKAFGKSEYTDVTKLNRERLELLAKEKGALGDAAREMMALLEVYDQHVAALRAQAVAQEAADRAAGIQELAESAQIRILAAQGRADEADAMRREIARREELLRAQELGDAGLIALLHTLYEFEDAALAAAKATEEARRAFSIAQTEMEIGARGAALEGRDRDAFIIRAQAEAQAEIQRWKDALEDDLIERGQFERLVDIIGKELVQAVQDFDRAVQKARSDFLDWLEIDTLQSSGDETGARIAQVNQQRDDAIEEATELFGHLPDKLNEVIAQINANADAKIADILASDRSSVAAISAAQSEDAVTRNARSITSMQASAITDLLWSINAGVQEIATNTRGVGASGIGATLTPTTVYDTGAETHIVVQLTGIFDLSAPGAADRVARQIAEAIDREMGGLNADATQATGTVLL